MLCGAFYLARPVHAAESTLNRPELVALRESLRKTGSLSARFKQSRHWAALQDTLVTEGSIRYQKAGPLVWHTDPPAESTLTLEGRTARLSMPGTGTEQTVDLSSDPAMAKVFDSIAAVLQADLEALTPLFEVRVLKSRAPLRLELSPKSTELEKTVKRIQLEFQSDKDRAKLTRVDLEEGTGDRTEIMFFGHRIVPASGP